jgi:hypothetical protein
MAAHAPRYTPDEFARLGQEAYDSRVRPALRPEDDGKYVAIDVESGDFEIDADDFAATDRLLARRPTAQTWLMRVGEPAAYRIGAGRSPGKRG